MKKSILILIVLAITGISFIAVNTLIAADLPDEIVIEGDSYKKDKKGPVKLSHLKHSVDYKVACDDCHHDYQDGKNVWTATDDVKKCSECHDYNAHQGNVKKLQTSYHNNCKNCHKEANKEGKEAPAKKCNGCHAKK